MCIRDSLKVVQEDRCFITYSPVDPDAKPVMVLNASGIPVKRYPNRRAHVRVVLKPTVKHCHLMLSLIHISEPTRLLSISYAVFCLKKKNTKRRRNRKRNEQKRSEKK
eukprot:TRINITY_DN33031_c0_g1_i1.p2 TRINITY_DN33031_c0_g1~~TRINITY_DN33031_c0_g1_i1.p2  ORF type:complete len:108 (+),score=18.41 TRINITY_DN33031_c0_g1_i1:172-495(+)